jgi:MFS family permease
MELDDLKYQLKAKLEAPNKPASEAALTKALHGNTQSVLGKLKKSLLFEIIVGILFLAAFIYVAVTSPWWSIRVYFNIFNVVVVVFLLYLFALLQKVNKVSASAVPVKTNLEMVLKVLSEFVKRYFQFTMGLIPVCFGLSFWLGYQDGMSISSDKPMPEFIHFSSSNQVLLFFGIYAIALTVGIYYFTKWYLRKLYGKYLDELAALIKELEHD